MPFQDNKREKMIVLLTMCFALFMAMLDNTVVNVALPTLRKPVSMGGLGAGVSHLQWIVDGYVLAFASLLLTGGILGDKFGRKRMFLSGLALFSLGSLLCGLSTTPSMLIAFRGLQGVGGALLIPGTLSILTVTFPPQERAQALGIWAGVSGIALALGPTLGGYLVEHAGWHWIFFINVPIGLLGFIVGARVVRETRAEYARKLDIGGLALGTAGLFAMTYGLIQANEPGKGWTDPLIIGSLTASIVLIAAFLRWEHRSDHAMMPLRFYRIPAFSAGNAVAFAVSMGMFGTFFFMSLFMQFIRGYSPFSTGLRLLPMTAMIIVTAPNAGKFASRHGSRLPMTAGLTAAGAGLLLLTLVNASTPYALMVPVMMIMGMGMASVIAPMTAAVMNAVGPERAGLGSSMTNTSREVGGVFGIALLGTLLTTKLQASLTSAFGGATLTAAQRATIADSARLLDPRRLFGLGRSPEEALRIFRDSYVSGFHLTLGIAGAILLGAAYVAWRFIPAHAHRASSADEAVVVAH